MRRDAGIHAPADLRGKRVGVPEYQITAVVWMRGLMQHEYGVTPAEIHWRSGGQEERLEMRDFMRAFDQLSASYKEALLLVGARGVSHEEAAQIAGCAVGTIKSRVSRARAQLQRILNGDDAREDAPRAAR